MKSEFDQNYKKLIEYYQDANKEKHSISDKFWVSLNLKNKPFLDLTIAFLFVIIGIVLRVGLFALKCLAFYLVGYLIYLSFLV